MLRTLPSRTSRFSSQLPSQLPSSLRVGWWWRGWGVQFWLAALVLGSLVICALAADLLVLHDPLQAVAKPLSLPSGSHWLGADALGRDIFSRLLFGARVSLSVACGACLLSGGIGFLLGALGGLLPRAADFLLQRLLEAWQSLPLLVAAVVLVAVVGPSKTAVVVAIALPLAPRTARLVRTLVLELRQHLFIQAAHLQAISYFRILLFHLLPNLYAPLLVLVSAQLGHAVLLEASLSFLGLGIPDPTPSWGRMLAELSLAEATQAPWLLWAPGTAIACLVLASNLLGDALRERLDPLIQITKPWYMPMSLSINPPTHKKDYYFRFISARLPHNIIALLPYHLKKVFTTQTRSSEKQSAAKQNVATLPLSNTKSSPRHLLEIEDVSVVFHARQGKVRAVSNLSLNLKKGQTMGLVGESGCGKTVAALTILKLIPSPPVEISGSIHFEGKDLLSLKENQLRRVRGNDISMIFQEPMTSLNPVLTVGFQISEVIRLHQGLSKKEARQKTIEMLDVVRIPEPHRKIDEYPHNMSGGMRQRVMIAMALSCNPKVLIADEPTTALDVTIQAQILELLADLCHKSKSAVLMITHDLGVVAQTCQRVAVMYAGFKVEESSVNDLFSNPKHPYTLGLMRSLPSTQKSGRLREIPGIVPPLHDLPAGCVFRDRCSYATEKCRQHRPPLEKKSDGHLAACWHSEKLSA